MALGRTVHVVKKRIENCKVVVVDGVRYRDVTELLYEESKYEKTYPTDEEWEKVDEYKSRQLKAKTNAIIRSRELEAIKLEDEMQERIRIGEEQRKRFVLLEKQKIREEKEEIRRKEREIAKAARKQQMDEAKKRKDEKLKREKEIQKTVLKALESGVKRKDIGEKFGFKRNDIVKAIDGLHKSGKLEKKAKRRYKNAEDEILIRMRKGGALFEEIGKALDRSTASTVNRWVYLEKQGVV